jgi:sigma-E factor negative regulatory protein RseC
VKEIMDVIDIDDEYIYLKTLRTEACNSCSVRSGCYILGGSNELKLKAKRIENIDFQIGDKVIVELPNVPVVKLSFLAYGLPLITFLTIVIILYLLNFSDLMSFLIGLAGTCITYLFVKFYDNKKIQNKYLPTIIEKYDKNQNINNSIL